MYGCFFPGDLVMSYTIYMLFINEVQYLGSSLRTLRVCYGRAIHRQAKLFKKYA